MDPHSFIARAEAQRWIGIAEKLLMSHDLVGSKTFAIRARDSDPRLEAADQILAIADTLLSAEKPVVGNNGAQQPDYYAILQLVRFAQDTEQIASQYRRLAVTLNPHQNRFPYSDQAFQLVNDAWAVLSNPMRKSIYDSEIEFQPPQPQQQMNTIGFNLEQQQHHHNQHHHQHQQQHNHHPQQQHQQQHNFFSLSGHEQELAEPPPQQQTFQSRVQQQQQQQQQSHQHQQHPQQLQQHNFLSQPNNNPVRSEQLFHHREQEQLFQQHPQVQPFQVTSAPQQQQQTRPSIQSPQPQIPLRQPTPPPQPPSIQSPPPPPPAAPPFSWPQAPPQQQHLQPPPFTLTKPQQPLFQPKPQPQPQPIPQPEQDFQQKQQTQQVHEEQEEEESLEQNADPVQLSSEVNGNNYGVRVEDLERETEEVDEEVDDDSPTFWTACPYCFYMYEYQKMYAECTLRCDNCKRAFQAVRVPSAPPIIEGQESCYYCWGFFPLGVSMSHLEKTHGKGTKPKWTPFSPLCEASSNVENHLNGSAAPKENLFVNNKSSGPRIYIDDITDDVFMGISEPSDDDSDAEWNNRKSKVKRMKKGLEPSFKMRPQVLAVRARDAGNGSVKHPQDAIPVQEVVGVGVATRRQSGRVAKELGKLDLNVEFNNNEGEEAGARVSVGNRGNGEGEEENIEGIGFFEGLDEFLDSLPILSVVNEEKVTAA